MYAVKSKTAWLLPALACAFIAFTAAGVRAALSSKQARKAITRMAGFELKDDSVRVKTVSETSAGTAEVSAEIKTVFKLAQDKDGHWRVAEFRIGQDRWEEISFIASALMTQVPVDRCMMPAPPARGSQATDPSIKRARCLLGSLLGVQIPSDAVRIQEVAPMPIPLATQGSATVVAWLRVDTRLLKDKSGWRVSELRTGNRDWVTLGPLVAAVTEQKVKQAQAELALMTKALERFRRDRGFYIVSDNQAVAIDHLSPRYLAQVIRVDPWGQPYKYQGERDRFTLRSAGPDGKVDTPDDILVQSR